MKHSAVRQRIIETASSLFYKNGFNSTGINEVISESGIAKATLYAHFKSKDDLCVAYIKYKNSIFLEDIEQFCASKKSGKDQVLGIFKFLELFFNDKDFNGCWCINTMAEISIDNILIRNEIQHQKKKFQMFITDLINSNLDLTSNETNRLSKQLYLLYESAVSESHLHQDNWPIKEALGLGKYLVE